MLIAVWFPTGHGPLFEEYGTQSTELGMLYDDPLGVFPAPDRCSFVVTQSFRDRFNLMLWIPSAGLLWR